MIPAFLIRPLTYIGIFIFGISVGFYKGCSYSESVYIESGIEQAEKNAKILSKTTKDTESKTRKLYEDEIKRLKNRKHLPDKCILSAEFRRMHDNASGVSESATAQTVTVEVVASTIESNYFACKQNAIWLDECNRICK